MLAPHHLRAAVQVARAAVVAQAAPQRQHVVQRRGGQRGHVGKALQEARVVVQHRGHLRLLQHDLGQPDAVRVARVLPGQALAAELPAPAQHALRDVAAPAGISARCCSSGAAARRRSAAAQPPCRRRRACAGGAAPARPSSRSAPLQRRPGACPAARPRRCAAPARRRPTWMRCSASWRCAKARRRSRSCCSICADAALLHSSTSPAAFSKTTRSLDSSMRWNCSMKLGAGQPPGLRRPEVAAVAALDQVQLLDEALQLRRAGQREGEAELGVQLLVAGAEHLLDLVGLARAACASAARSRSHSGGEGLARAEVAAASRPSPRASPPPRRAARRWTARASAFCSWRRCTARSADSRAVQRSKSPISASSALQHQLHLGAALAAQAAQFEHLLGVVAAPVAQAARGAVAQRLQRARGRARQQLALPRQQLRAPAPLPAPAGGCAASAAASPLDARGQRIARRQREHARRPACPASARSCARWLLELRRQLRPAWTAGRPAMSILLSTTKRSSASLAEVLAPDRQVGARHAGVGAEQEDDGMRRRQQAQRQLGLGADGVQPRRVDHHQPALAAAGADS